MSNTPNNQSQVTTLIQNILQSNNNTLRAQNQKLLTVMTNVNVGELSSVFINILRTETNLDIKKFVLTHLRKTLAIFDNIKYQKVWGSISEENQIYIKQSLFEILHKEQSPSVRMICADAIGEIAGTLLKIDKKNWPKFTQCIFILLNDPNPDNVASGLGVLESFFNYCPQFFIKQIDQFAVIFEKAFAHEKNKVKSAAIKCFANYAFSLDKKRASKLEHLIIPLYEITYHLLINDNSNSDGIETISQIVQTEPYLVKKTFVQLNQLVQKIVNIKDLQSGIKKIGTESLLVLAQKYPSLYRKNQQLLVGLVEMIFVYMIDIDNDVSEQWKCPPEGFEDNVAEGDDQTITFGMSSVDRLISSVGEKQILPILSNTVQKMVVMSDWRYKYASLMALSQTGEYIEDASQIKQIVDMLLGFLGDNNPMLRYAACHAIGQISDDLSPHYQRLYGSQSFIKLAGLLRDPVPRVVAHAASAITNLLEQMQYTEIKDYMPQLMGALVDLITNGISIVKQSAMTTIASLGEVAQKNFIPYFQKTSQAIFNTIENHHGKEYKQLLGLSIEAITAIGQSIGKQVFSSVAPTLIQYLINVQETKLQEVDPQRQYVLAGWQRICSTFGKDMLPYLPRVLPNLLTIVQNLMKQRVKTSSLLTMQDAIAEKDLVKVNTYETEQADAAITMIKVFLNQMQQLYIPYVERTTRILLILVQSSINESVKTYALQCLPLIVKLLRNSKHEQTLLYTKNFLNILTKVALKQYDTEMIAHELQAMRKIFQFFDTKFLSPEELNGYTQLLIKILSKSNERKDDTKDLATDQIQEQQKQLLEEQIQMQEEVQVSISELIGQLFKTHKQMNKQLVQYIIKNIFPQVFRPGQSPNIYKFGLFLIDDMIQYLGSDIVGHEIWINFQPVFIEFCLNKHCIVRQASCYGLGIYAQKTPAQLFKPFIEKSLQTLAQAIQIPQNKEDQKMYLHSKENAIAAFGKIIKSHGSSFDPKACLNMWLGYLPLKNDKLQAHIQHDFLADIVNNNLSLLVQGETPQAAASLLKILQIFGDILQTKYSNQKITQKIKTAVISLKQLPLFISNYDTFWSKLRQHQIIKISKIVKSA